MTKSREDKRQAHRAAERIKGYTETRIDPAHEAVRGDPALAAPGVDRSTDEAPQSAPEHRASVLQPVAAEASVLADAAGERLRKQADQLATHLRSRQKEVDSRESQLNAQLAQFDRDARSARMWLSEREAGLARRAEELDQREQEIKVRLARVASEAAHRGASGQSPQNTERETDLARREQELKEREQAFKDRETKLAENESLCLAREQALSETPAAVPPVAETPSDVHTSAHDERAAELARLTDQIEGKQHDIQRAEAQLAQAVAETERLRQQLHADRERIARETTEMRQQMQQEHRLAMAEVERLRKTVQRRSEHVDRTRTALRQLRMELGRVHRETLENQLATEELWIRMSDNAPAASLTRSLARIRSRLAETYRLSNADLQSQQEELEKLRSQIAEQFEKLQQQKREVEHWAVVKHEEADKYAARLIARERELEEQHYEIQEQAQRLQAERLSYHRAIRRIETEQGNLPQSGTAG